MPLGRASRARACRSRRETPLLPADTVSKKLIEEEGGVLEDTFAIMGPWDFLALVKYPDNAAAFRALAKIGKLEVIKTETFPIEKVDLFIKALV